MLKIINATEPLSFIGHNQLHVDLVYNAYRIRRDKVAKPLAGYTASIGGLSGIGLIRVVRASSSSIATRISIRARGAPGQTWIPAPYSRFAAGSRSSRNASGSLSLIHISEPTRL